MRVGLIVTEVGAGVGGRFTFQESILAAVERLRGETYHEFSVYASGLSRYSTGSAGWWARRGARTTAGLAIGALRETQDALIGKRLVHVRTPLERTLRHGEVDVAWFPTTYIEDVDCPFICTIFDLEHRTKPWFPEVSARGEFERRERALHRHLPKATRIIVPNETAVAQVTRFYGVSDEACLVLGHPTPSFALDAPDDERPAQPNRPSYLFYPAQFWPHKNHAAALDTLRELRSRGRDLELVLVGSDKGQLGHVRRQARERGIEDAVRFSGFVSTDELVALYRGAHALLFLSRFSPENLPPLEAFALGCPAVVADIPGAREQYGDAALLVDWRDPAAVADAVETLDEPDLRRELVERGRQRARAWTADDYVRGVLRFLDEFETERRLWPSGTRAQA